MVSEQEKQLKKLIKYITKGIKEGTLRAYTYFPCSENSTLSHTDIVVLRPDGITLTFKDYMLEIADRGVPLDEVCLLDHVDSRFLYKARVSIAKAIDDRVVMSEEPKTSLSVLQGMVELFTKDNTEKG